MSHWAPISFFYPFKPSIPFDVICVKNPEISHSNVITSSLFESELHITHFPFLFHFIELAPLVPPYCRSVWSVDALSSAGKASKVCRHSGKKMFLARNTHPIGNMYMRTKVEARATHKHSMTSTLSLHSVDVSTRNSNDMQLSK